MSAPRQCGRCGMITCCECGWPLLLAGAIADLSELHAAAKAVLALLGERPAARLDITFADLDVVRVLRNSVARIEGTAAPRAEKK